FNNVGKISPSVEGLSFTYTFQNVTSDHTIQAVFAPGELYFMVKSIVGAGGTMMIEQNNFTYQPGEHFHFWSQFEVVKYYFFSDPGFKIKDVLVDGNSVGPVSSYTFENIDNNHTIEAQFIEAVPPSMTAISFAGVDGTGSGDDWTVDISGVTNESLLDSGSITVSEDCTLTTKTIDGVDVSGWGFNTVSLIEGENTGGIKSLLGFSQDVTFAILKAQDVNHDGYLTVVVELEDSADNISTVTINIKLDETPPDVVSITAVIDGVSQTVTPPQPLTCTVGSVVTSIKVLLTELVQIIGTPVVTIDELSNAPYGTISLDPEDSTHKTIIVTPYLGNERAGLAGTFHFRVPQGAVKDAWGNENEEQAYILTVNPIITASAGEGGTITPSGEVVVPYNGSQTFTITPNEGYRIKDVLIDGGSIGPVS
ncbi:MAG: hypothetical protein QXF82_05450, partial [Nitrososphaeria archaeon]